MHALEVIFFFFSGLTNPVSHIPASDLKSGLISETDIESFFRRDVKNQSNNLNGSTLIVLTNEGVAGGVGQTNKQKEIKGLTPCFQPSAGRGCRCVRRWRGRGWCWRTWSSRSHDPRGTFSGAGIDLKGSTTRTRTLLSVAGSKSVSTRDNGGQGK